MLDKNKTKEQLIAELESARQRLALLEAREQLQGEIQSAFLENLVETTPAAVVIHRDEKILYANAAAMKMMKVESLAQVIGKSVFEFIHPDDHQLTKNHIIKIKSGHIDTCEVEEKLIRTDGHIIDVELLASLVPYQGEMAIQSLFFDITERKEAERVLQKSEEKYRALFDSSPDAIFIRDEEKILYANPMSLKMLGATTFEEVVSKEIAQFISADGMEFTKQRTEKMARSGEGTAEPMETTLYRLDGTSFEGEASGVPIIYEGKQAFQTVIRDITERKEAERALEESEEKYRKLVDSNPAAIIIHKPDGEILYVNATSVEIFGADKLEDIFKKRISDYVHPDSQGESKDRIERVLSGEEKRASYEIKLLRMDGQAFNAEVKGTTTTYLGELAIQVFISDITERVESDKTIRQLSRAVNQSNSTIVITDLKGNIEFTNPAFTKIAGYTAEEALGQNPRILKSGQVSLEVYQDLWQTILNGETWQGELINKKKNGELYWEAANISPVKDSNGEITHFVAVKEDITARKNAELALNKSEEKYRNLVEQSNDGIAILSSEGIIVEWNQGMVGITGISTEDAIGSFMWDIQYRFVEDSRKTPAMAKKIKTGLQTLLSEQSTRNAPKQQVHNIQRQDGSIGNAHLTVFPIRTKKDFMLGIFARDVTEQKKSTDALRASEERFRALVENAPLGIVTTDVEGHVVDANAAMLKILGSPSLEATQAINVLTFPLLIQAGITELFKRCLNNSETIFAEKRYTSKWGKTADWRISIAPLYDVHGNATLAQMLVDDITEKKEIQRNLIESETRFRAAFENTALGMALTDIDGHYLKVNQALCAMLGYTEVELLLLSYQDITHPDDLEMNLKQIERLQAGELPFLYLQKRYIHKSGRIIWVDLSVAMLRGQTIEDDILNIQIQDITERKRAVTKLAQRATQLENLHKMGLAIISKLDLDSILDSLISSMVQTLNAKMGGIYLYNPERDLLEWVIATPDYPLALGALLHKGEGMAGKVWQNKRSLIVENYAVWEEHAQKIITGLDEPLHAAVEVPMLWRDEFLGVLCVNGYPEQRFTQRDIQILELIATQASTAIRNARLFKTERQARQEAETLQAATQALGSTLDPYQVLNTILVELKKVVPYDSCSVLQLHNDSLKVIAGHGFENWKEIKELSFDVNDENNPSALVVKQKTPLILANALEEFASFRQAEILTENIRSWLGVPLLLEGEAMGLIAVDRSDIGFFTDKHAQIAQAFATQAAIALRNAQLFADTQRAKETAENSRLEAEQANRAKSIFLANMSHELRTPLNAILGFAQILGKDETLTRHQRKNIGIIERSGDHLLNLISEVLEISKIEAGRATLSPQHFDFYNLLNTLETIFELRTQEKGLLLTIERDARLPRYLFADEGKIRQSLINLIGNSIKFTVEGSVTLRVRASSEVEREPLCKIICEVQDTGPGIPLDETEHLFEPFVQTRSGEKTKGGTGLGLSITREYARLMNGDLILGEAPESGALFIFTAEVEITEASRLSTREARGRVLGLSPADANVRILIVEDNPENRAVITEILTINGLEVRFAENGLVGVETSLTFEPDLIFMDIQMPMMDGFEATRRIKEKQTIPIVALTAAAFENERKAILESGFDDFLLKPVRTEQIWEILEKHLSVEFIYSHAELPEEKSLSQQSVPADLAMLPRAQIAQLRQAAIEANRGHTYEVIEKIRESNETLAEKLTALVDDFRFDKLIEITTLDNEETA